MKQPNRYKLTPQIHKQLVSIAHNLPQLQQLSKNGNPLVKADAQFLGTDLTKEAALNRMGYQKSIQRIKKPVLVNHEVNLIDKYQKFGMDRVNEYVDAVNQIAKQYAEQHPNEVPAT